MELSNFILLYFKTKGVSLITAFLCWSPEQQLDLWRAGLEGGVRVRASAGDAELPAYDVWREGVVADVACGFTPQLLQKASDSRSFNLRHTWLLLHNAPYNSSYLEDLLAESLILPDADVLWSSNDVLAEVYRLKAGQPLLKTEFDYTENITSEALLRSYAKISSTVSRRKDLQRIYLKSATIITQPQHFKGWSDVSNRYVDNFPKLTYPLMMDLARDLNFRYNMLQVDLYGEEHNRTFDGLAGRLERNEIEIGICSMFMRKDRWRVMHFCSEVTDLRGAFMFRQPSKSTVSNMFLLPFSRGVWCASAGVFLGVALLLAGLSRHLRTFDDALGRLTAMETFTFALGTVCQQGFHIIPELASVRIVMFFTLITSVFVFTAYSAKIVAILQTPSDSIQTIADITSSPMAVGVQETTYKRVYFAESTEPATQLLYRKKLLPLGDRAYMSAVEGINRMRTGLFAFQAEEGSGYDIISKTFTESEKCGLKQIQAFRLPMVAVPIRKHSGYKELLAVRLRWYREVGMLSRERRVWLAEKPRCDAGGGGGFVSVGLRDVRPAGQVLLLGHAAAIAALLAERALHRLTLKKRSLENI